MSVSGVVAYRVVVGLLAEFLYLTGKTNVYGIVFVYLLEYGVEDEVFLFGEDYYLKTTMEDFEDLDNLEKNAIVCINLDNGEPRNFKDDDLVLSVSGSFVEIDLNGGE